MSLTTWKEEFYPIAAKDVPAHESASHSLQKWQGALPDALAKHQMQRDGRVLIMDRLGNRFAFGWDSCALCSHFIDELTNCEKCPIKIITGRSCCEPGAYDSWNHGGSPRPMIALLKKCVKLQARKGESK